MHQEIIMYRSMRMIKNQMLNYPMTIELIKTVQLPLASEKTTEAIDC
jgi:hypothetical protein